MLFAVKTVCVPIEFWKLLSGVDCVAEPGKECVQVPIGELLPFMGFAGRKLWHEWRLSARWQGDLLGDISNELEANPIAAPSLAELASNFAQATIKWVKAGFPVATSAVLSGRRETCESCPHFIPDSLVSKCALCGCSSLKLWLATERCPAGKWGAVQAGGKSAA